MNTSTDRILTAHVAVYGAIAISIVLASLARVLASSGTAKAVPYVPMSKAVPYVPMSLSSGTGTGDTSDVHLLHVQGHVYMLVSAGGNVTVQVGDDGVLLVDTSVAEASGKVL